MIVGYGNLTGASFFLSRVKIYEIKNKTEQKTPH